MSIQPLFFRMAIHGISRSHASLLNTTLFGDGHSFDFPPHTLNTLAQNNFALPLDRFRRSMLLLSYTP